jgi:hypothetical protein
MVTINTYFTEQYVMLIIPNLFYFNVSIEFKGGFNNVVA